VKVALKAMVLTDNAHEIAQMRRLAAERGVAFRIDPNLSARFSGDRSPLLQRVPAEQAVALEMEDSDLARRSAEFYESRLSQRPDPRLYGCLAGVTLFHVDPRGRLMPCQVPAGWSFDLTRGSFRDGWRELAGFHEQPAPAGFSCHACAARSLCGQCPAQFALENGSPHVKSDYNCRLGAARVAALGAAGARGQGVAPAIEVAAGEG
jgi:radical SAM protein with 4Fe4S-binding SPASM domain